MSAIKIEEMGVPHRLRRRIRLFTSSYYAGKSNVIGMFYILPILQEQVNV
ncbi:hypothetical protein QMN03_12735 [Leptospira santarosai]|nr:hypothetical protein [Leptospira santarosai]MDI7207744.1 hypothetical protein [Leptospira santarosai]